jgi:hypothetical protein
MSSFAEWHQGLVRKIAAELGIPDTLILGDYRCPFDFINQHEQWFEWKRRVIFDGQSTGAATVAMLGKGAARYRTNSSYSGPHVFMDPRKG